MSGAGTHIEPAPGGLVAIPWLRDLAGILVLAIAGILVRYVTWRYATGGGSVGDYVQAFCVWDCGWYRTIVENGYDKQPGMLLVPGAANWAFFPLYPTIVALIRWPTGLDAQVIGFTVSNLMMVATAWFSRPLFLGRDRAWWLYVAMLALGPFAFLWSILYTESLFVLLTVLVLLMLQRRNYLAAGIVAGLLSATRVTGVLMVFAIVTQMLIDHLRDGRSVWSFPSRVLGDPRMLLGIFLAPVGLCVYGAYLYILAGDALGFAHIQRAWNRELVNPLWALWDGLSQTVLLTADAQVITAWSWGTVAGLALTIVLVVQRRIAAAVFCLLCIAVSLSAGVGSMVRFVVGLAPLGIAAADILARNRVVMWIAIPLLIGAGAALTVGWFNTSLFVM